MIDKVFCDKIIKKQGCTMVRKLKEEDKNTALDFLMDEAAFNLFIIGDILNAGFEQPFMEIWGEFDGSGRLIAVLLRYYNNFIPYYKEPYEGDINRFKNFIYSYGRKKLVSGKWEIAEKFTGALKDCVISRKVFCELRDKSKLFKGNAGIEIKKASLKDADRLSDFIDTIEEFRNTGENREMLRESIQSSSGRYYFIESGDGKVVSVAGTSAENPYAAMIVSVATDKSYRKQGLALSCISKLCSDVSKDCEKLCLFYDNPEAGKIYHGIGFETIGGWMIAAEK